MLSIVSSVGALGWSMALLAIIQIIASIFMAQVLADFMLDDAQPLEPRVFVFKHFGSWTNAMLTMFEITLAPGAWGHIGRRLI